MSEHERLLHRLGKILDQVARPYGCDEALPANIRVSLWQFGLTCNEKTSRQELIARLWDKKRSLLTSVQPEWGGPGVTPPTAA